MPQTDAAPGTRRPDGGCARQGPALSGGSANKEFRDLLRRSIDCLRLGACVAGLSDDFPRRPAGSRPIVGSVIPGSTIILALSALIPGGELDIAACVGGGDRRRRAGRWHRILDRASRAARDPERVADVALSERDRAKRGVLSPLGRAGGILRALRAADPRLRTDHRGRAWDGAAALLRGQYRGDPAVGAGACPARRAGGIGAGPGRRLRRA